VASPVHPPAAAGVAPRSALPTMESQERAALAEITRQLQKLGGQGKIWVNNWRQRFGQLGDFRAFVELHADKLTLIPGNGKEFELGLVLSEEAQNELLAESAQEGLEGNPVALAALHEIEGQVSKKGGTGKIWVENWKGRFGELGEFKAFLESFPDRFSIIPGAGKDFEIALNEDAEKLPPAPPALFFQGQKGGGGASLGHQYGAFKGGFKGPPQAFGGSWGYGGKGYGGIPARQPMLALADSDDHLAAAAIAEITQQVTAKGGVGKIWIPGWRERYGQLGKLEDFVAMRPDKFAIIKDGTKSFAIAVTGHQGATSGRVAGKGGYWGNADPLVAELIQEIQHQLYPMGGLGKIWIQDWNARFGRLGNIRDFLLSHPDKFTVIPGAGKEFAIGLVDKGGGKGGGYHNGGVKRQLSDMNRSHPPPAKRARIPIDFDNPLVTNAMEEIESQLNAKGGTGKIWIENWRERFGNLGPFKDFVESMPEKLQILPGKGKDFALQLLEAKEELDA